MADSREATPRRTHVPRHAVVSVGTANTYGHPSDMVIRALTGNNVPVMCTQITSRCFAADFVHQARSVTLPASPPEFPGLSTAEEQTTPKGDPANIGCASTVLAILSGRDMDLKRYTAHRGVIRDLARHDRGCPMCIPASENASRLVT